MLLFLPVIILFLVAVAILVLQTVRRGFGYAWLVASASALVAWGLILAFHWWPTPLTVQIGWSPLPAALGEPVFAFDAVSWPYAFSLAGLVVAVILTASARLQLRSNPYVWSAVLALGGIGILGSLAVTPLALLLTWSLLDLAELVVMLLSVNNGRLNQQSVVAFSARVLGSFMIIFAMMYSRSNGVSLSLENVIPRAGLFLLLGAGLRLGVLPLHLPYSQEILSRRGLGTVLRMVTAATSLVLLARLSLSGLSPVLFNLLAVFTALALIYAGVMWLIARDEIRGRPYWLIAFSGLVMVCVLQGKPEASIAWVAAALLSGGLLFLYSGRNTVILFLPILGALGMSGLPFTPAASGWQGLFSGRFHTIQIAVILTLALLLVGYIRHMLRPADDLKSQERWVHAVYPLGLIFLIATHWLINVLGWKDASPIGVWWGSLPVLLLAAGGVLLVLFRQRIGWLNDTGWVSVLFSRLRRPAAAFFSLEWIYQLLGVFYRLIQRIVLFTTELLEGEGGVLWVLLLLALLVTLLQNEGGL